MTAVGSSHTPALRPAHAFWPTDAPGAARVAVADGHPIMGRADPQPPLRESSRLALAVLDSLSAHVAVVDESGTILAVNRAWREFAAANGPPGAEVTRVAEGANYLRVCDEAEGDDAPSARAFAAGLRDVLEGRRDGFALEYPCHAPGRPRWFVGRVTPLACDGPPRAVVSHEEVTARTQAERALRESESVLRSFYDGTPAALAVAEVRGGDFRLVSANAALARLLLGHLPDEGRGVPADALVVPDQHRRRWLDAHREALHAGRPAQFEQFWKTADGPGWFEVMIIPIAEEPGRGPRFCVVVQDVTERKRAEREIIVLNTELEARLERFSSLREIDRAITGGHDLTLTLGVVIDQALSRLKVDAAGILLCRPEAPYLGYAVRKGYRDGATAAPQRLDEGPAGRAVLENRTQHPDDSSGLHEGARREGFTGYWAVPLVARGRVKGVLEVGHRSPIDPEPEWLGFLEDLAGQAAIAVENAELFEGLRQSNLELTLAYDATIEGWSRAMDLRDHETEGHSRRVTEMTLRLARAIGLPEAELVHVRRGALLHDIGKLGVPDSILSKPGPLTLEEREVMQRHPAYALEMLAPIAFLRPALDIPYAHHEKWDGTGYPRGLKGVEIPLAARIFAAVDVWDALRSDRPYRKGWPDDRVVDHIASLAGNHFDPGVVAVFLNVLRDSPSPLETWHARDTASALLSASPSSPTSS